MGKVLFKLFAVLCATAVLIQLVPVDRSNPPVTGEISAPAQVMAALRSSCYDCHSNETVWPWYSLLAPVSWRVTGHVREGREHLNFSTWEEMTEEDQDQLREEIWEKIEKGAMPLPDYLRMHPEAELSSAYLEAIQRWSQGQASRYPDWDR
jgi:hypothetical protein